MEEDLKNRFLRLYENSLNILDTIYSNISIMRTGCECMYERKLPVILDDLVDDLYFSLDTLDYYAEKFQNATFNLYRNIKGEINLSNNELYYHMQNFDKYTLLVTDTVKSTIKNNNLLVQYTKFYEVHNLFIKENGFCIE